QERKRTEYAANTSFALKIDVLSCTKNFQPTLAARANDSPPRLNSSYFPGIDTCYIKTTLMHPRWRPTGSSSHFRTLRHRRRETFLLKSHPAQSFKRCMSKQYDRACCVRFYSSAEPNHKLASWKENRLDLGLPFPVTNLPV